MYYIYDCSGNLIDSTTSREEAVVIFSHLKEILPDDSFILSANKPNEVVHGLNVRLMMS